MRKLESLRFADTEKYQDFYAGIMGGTFVVSTNPAYADARIRVYHKGIFMGTPEQMEEYFCNYVSRHLIDTGQVVKVDETVTGGNIWGWNDEQ